MDYRGEVSNTLFTIQEANSANHLIFLYTNINDNIFT